MDLAGVDHETDLLMFGKRATGIAPTKTLAKLENHAMKKFQATDPVMDLMSSYRQKRLLALVDVSEI